MSLPLLRFWRCGVLLGAALLVAGCGEAPPPRSVAHGLREAALEWQGRNRTLVWMRGESALPGRAVPLVLAFHGSGGSGAEMAATSGLSRLANAAGFVAVFPDGVEATWADGRGSTPADRAGVDDVGLARRIVRAVAAESPVDPRRVYAAGYSNGGMLVQRLALEAPGLLAAAASVGAGLPEPLAGRRPVAPVPPLLLIHGTADPVVPWDGGVVNSPNGGRVLSVPATVRFWVQAAGADPAPERGQPPDRWDDGTRLRTEVYRAASDSAARVTLVAVEGGGHAWPGDPAFLPGWVLGRGTRELDAAPYVWEFLRHHVRAAKAVD